MIWLPQEKYLSYILKLAKFVAGEIKLSFVKWGRGKYSHIIKHWKQSWIVYLLRHANSDRSSSSWVISSSAGSKYCLQACFVFCQMRLKTNFCDWIALIILPNLLGHFYGISENFWSSFCLTFFINMLYYYSLV